MGLGLAYPDYGVLGVATDSNERSGKLEQRVVLWYILLQCLLLSLLLRVCRLKHVSIMA